MAINKIIYGKGRAPRPSEFSEGDIIINVDDAKVYSKTKTNEIFEIGGGGDSFSSATFTTGSKTFQITPSIDFPRLSFEAGTGISFTQEDNVVLIEATGEAATSVNASDIVGDILLSQIDVGAGSGISFNGGVISVRTGDGLAFQGGDVAVQDIFLKNNADDESTGTITAANIHTNGIVKLAGTSTVPTAVAGGIYYDNNDAFYLGFSS